jgi:hypothetical protein
MGFVEVTGRSAVGKRVRKIVRGSEWWNRGFRKGSRDWNRAFVVKLVKLLRRTTAEHLEKCVENFRI